MPERDEELLKYATESQKEKLIAYWECGSLRTAANRLGIRHQTVCDAVKAVKLKASKAGYASEHSMVKTVPEGYSVKGVSTLYNSEGEVTAQWVKSDKDKENDLNKLKLATEVLCQDVFKRSVYVPEPLETDKDLLCVYPLADLHVGMYSWIKETGDDYDCDIAEQMILGAVDRLVDSAPNSANCLVAGLGDWFHSDTLQNKTLGHGNILDVDTRWQRVFKIGVGIMRACVQLALKKHKNVKVVIVDGNHDQHTSYCLAMLMGAYFENNERVDVDLGVNTYRYHRFGSNLIGMTHGLIKEDKLPTIMAYDKAKDWGETKHRVWYIGHKHHQMIKEFPGCNVEMFRTLAAKDAWHSSMGYRSERDLQRIVLHSEYGEIERARVGLIQLKEGLLMK